MKTKTALQMVTIIAFLVFSSGCDRVPTGISATRNPLVPQALSLADFQRPKDQELMTLVREKEAGAFIKNIDLHFTKPLIDDVNSRSLTIEGLEVTATQFPVLHGIVLDCARILHMQHIPRVFVVERAGLLIRVENFSEPVVVLHTSVLRRFKDPSELRFLIGREMGHVLAGHVRWQSLLRSVQSGMNRLGVSGNPFSLAILPLLQWTREAEMTADNAGLICAQDIKLAETALVRLATGIDDFSLHEINVDEYLRQRESQRLSEFSDLALFWSELNRPLPFSTERIKELRDFEKSGRYYNLWR